MTAKDLSIVVSGITPIIREYVAAALVGLSERILSLEQREPLHGKDGAPGIAGRDGKDADVTVIAALQAELIALRAALSAQKDAEPRFTVADVAVLVQAEVAKAVAALPPAQNGRDGVSVDPAVVDVMVAAQVEKAVAVIPVPKDGTSVTLEDVQPFIAEEVEKAVRMIPVPKDGVGVAGALIDRDGQLVLTLSDGSTKGLGNVVGSSVNLADLERFVKSELESWPRPADGKDGLGFEDMEPVYDDIGRLSLRFVRGDLVKSFRVPGIVYRDLWDAGTEYEPGDTVTWGGSMWTAKQVTRGIAPDSPNSKQAWALSVMRGRQGKQGTKGDEGSIGKQGPMGPQGKPGY